MELRPLIECFCSHVGQVFVDRVSGNCGIRDEAMPVAHIDFLRFVLSAYFHCHFDSQFGIDRGSAHAMAMLVLLSALSSLLPFALVALRHRGAAPKADMEALWRRLVFDILISNTDDHLRNHGFLYEGRAGWRLSPANLPLPSAVNG